MAGETDIALWTLNMSVRPSALVAAAATEWSLGYLTLGASVRISFCICSLLII